ncbi:AAA family ATPase [Ruminiclostridium josui]|nr:AAA family ATPase [Ruminiclostridium josui]
MKQRLAIAEALIGGPKLVILDEPVNGLDPAGIHEVREIIKSLARKSGITFLISSHLLNEMELMADKLGIIKDGKLLYEGDLQKLTDKQVNRITVGVSDLRKAVDYFKSVGIQVSIQEKDLMIEGNYSTEDISKRLMGQGIGITCIYKQNDSLENIYLRMMDGQSN